jgi:hypothetical protein
MRSFALRCAGALSAAAILPFSTGVNGQIPVSAGAGAYYETYQFLDPLATGIKRLSLFTAPFAARTTLMRRASLEVRGAFAHGALLYADDSEDTLSGPTDTEVQLSVGVLPDRLTVTLGYLAPTGHATQTSQEAAVGGVLASDLLPLRVSNLGIGGAAGVSSTLTVPAGSFAVGMTAGYTVAQEFRLQEETEFAYRPGNELRARFGVERALGSGKASLILSLRRYSNDQLDGRNIYHSGNQYEAISYYSFASGERASGVVYAGILHREGGSFLLESQVVATRNLILAGSGWRVPVGRAVLVPSVDGRVFRRADGIGQGYIAGFGASVELPVGGMLAVPTLRSRFGRIVLWEGTRSGVRGIDFGLALRRGAPRI